MPVTAIIPLAIHLEVGNVILLLSVLVLGAILISRLGAKYGVPGMLLFLILGMLAGADGLGIEIHNQELTEFLCHLGMTIILLSGGLQTDMKHTRHIMGKGLALSIGGLIITVLATGAFIYFVLGDSVGSTGATLLGCLLIAAVLSSTDSPSVFSVLRSKRMHLRENLDHVLELESGSNDPIAYSLTAILIEVITSSEVIPDVEVSRPGGTLFVIALLIWQIAAGIGIGFAVGYGARWLMRRLRLGSGPLYSILILTLALLANGLASLILGNGLLALYVAAIIIGNMKDLPFKKDIHRFFESITWLAQLLMFLMLGLMSRPSHMPAVLGPALLLGGFIILVGRPLGVFLSLLPFRGLSVRARLYISWAGMKGAGPILFATSALLAGVEGGVELFNIVFIIALLSLLVQGTTLVPVARKLDMCIEDDPAVETYGMEMPEEMGMLRDHIVTEGELAAGKTLREMGLPHGIRVVMVRRDGKYLVPHGSMQIAPGDHLIIVIGDSDD